MTTRNCLVQTTRARWPEFAIAGLLLWSWAALAATAPGLEALSSAYRSSPTTARKAQLRRYASAHAKDMNGALALLALGTVALDQKEYPAAIADLSAARPRLLRIADYVDYYLGSARLAAEDFSKAAGDLEGVARAPVLSPLTGSAVILRARALIGANDPQMAVRILRDGYASLPQPNANLRWPIAIRPPPTFPTRLSITRRSIMGVPPAKLPTKLRLPC